MILELRLLENDFELVDNKDNNELYYDVINNNYILFTLYDDCTTDSIINGIREDVYNYLIGELNNNTNLIVEWSQVEGTTSDYDIYYDMTIPTDYGISYILTKDYINNIKKSGAWSYKYRAIKNGVCSKIEL